jgi:transcriptional regulator with XRE-family HTH domain
VSRHYKSDALSGKLRHVTTRTPLGEALKDARDRKGLSQAQLAEELGTDRLMVLRWEKGQVPGPDYQAKLTRALDLSRTFFDGYLRPTPTSVRLARRLDRLEEAVAQIERRLSETDEPPAR